MGRADVDVRFRTFFSRKCGTPYADETASRASEKGATLFWKLSREYLLFGREISETATDISS